VVIIGAGPAGLTAAYELSKQGVHATILEKDDVVGGISRTAIYKGYLFDIGGHRFFTKVAAVDRIWHEILDDDEFLTRPRLSRIYYNKKFFPYPLQAVASLRGLGLINSIQILLSYLWAQVYPSKEEKSFEQWVSNRFGKRLYNTFFKTYTEKVWGIPCTEITADWAAQRIKGLSLYSAVKDALIKTSPAGKGEVIKTLINEFQYPKRGPGMMWERAAGIVQERGHTLRMETCVDAVHLDGDKVTAVDVRDAEGGRRLEGTHFISSMPIRELLEIMSPRIPDEIREAGDSLNYRDFLTVALIIDKEDLIPDNWIYIHDPDVMVGRIQNFKNWSPFMVPDSSKTCLGLEYFCFEGDGLWTMANDELVELGRRELDLLGLAKAGDVLDGTVVRMPKAYPIYDPEYGEALLKIRGFLDPIGNLQLVGRNGMHRYNNQDHSMLTAMLAARNILGSHYNLWNVNIDDEYHEEKQATESELDDFAQIDSTQPAVPESVDPKG
jgi:protoporphyrinogen oxidase